MKKLMRSKNDKMLLGVCGGIAEYFEVDATLVRIAWVLGSLFLGTGIILYLIVGLLMPTYY